MPLCGHNGEGPPQRAFLQYLGNLFVNLKYLKDFEKGKGMVLLGRVSSTRLMSNPVKRTLQ